MVKAMESKGGKSRPRHNESKPCHNRNDKADHVSVQGSDGENGSLTSSKALVAAIATKAWI